VLNKLNRLNISVSLHGSLTLKKAMKTLKKIGLMAVTGLLFLSCNKKETKDAAITAPIEVPVMLQVPPNIVGVAAANDIFTTLVAAVTAAGLVETLSSVGPFTVFAPTNDAFAKLPEGTVASLLQPENKDMLTGILTYHVVAGKFEAATVIDAIKTNNGKFTVTTVQGGTIDLSIVDGKVMLTDAKGGMSMIVITDVAASNGIIHAIDSVVLPE
jgi:uncharacterized surface protein with fasciclin (FAS1) repeats